MNAPAPAIDEAVLVEAPARLHLGFVDLHRATGRRFGSLGLAVDGLTTRVCARRAARLVVSGDESGRARAYAEELARLFGLEARASLDVESAIPSHAGLGSGTQLALAVGTAIAHLCGQRLTAAQIAASLGRASRSGVGVGAFLHGGFLLDGGQSRDDALVPPITARVAFPQSWRIVLLFDPAQQGLHGEEEAGAFRALPELGEAASGRICRLVLTRVLPALMEEDIDGFGPALAEIQRVVGDHFAPWQGGRFASSRVARALAWCEHNGAACVGQSSWGPTGFVMVDNDAKAHALVQALQRAEGEATGLRLQVVRGRNRGADITLAAAGVYQREKE
jgi:beta-ribofuranosylaminobenzene 5'-phosphate synthase